MALAISGKFGAALYNAQVNALKLDLPEYRVGTVDKFQGQQAAVVCCDQQNAECLDLVTISKIIRATLPND